MYFTSASSRLLLHDTNNWDLKKFYNCYDGILRDISWSDDSKYLLQVNSKGVVEVLSAADHDIRSLQHVPLKDLWSASFHRDGHRNIGIGTKSGNVMIWDTKNKSITKTFPSPAQQYPVNFVSYNAKNTSLAATMQNGDTIIYGLVSNIPLMTVKLTCSKSISSMKFHQESRSLLGLATDEGHIVLRDITSNKDKVFFENVHASPVSDFTYSLINKDVMLSCGYDKIMNVYDIRLQNTVSTIKTSGTLTCLAINSENLVGLGTKSGSVLIYDLRDMSTPLKILKGHDEEVHRVAFQPLRKKLLSADISLKEDPENILSPSKISSPVRTRTSDMFFITDTPPKTNLDGSNQCETKQDSFLIMMGLDKTNNEFDEITNKSSEFEKKSDRHEIKYRQLDVEKNVGKASTPLTYRTTENLDFPSPIIPNSAPDEGRGSNINLSNIKKSNSSNCITNIENRTVDELKDFVKLTLANVADDNRNYFLHIMMALTKQKLFLEKQLCRMNEKVENLMHSQEALLETNRKLALEIDQLKANQNIF